jgi:tripartite-type tricarboxylate transporter receptor subunit TctC
MTLVGGKQVDMMCDQTTNTTGQIEAGRVKALQTTFLKTKLLKDSDHAVPMGLESISDSTIWHGLYVSPKAHHRQSWLNTAPAKVALKDPDLPRSKRA